MFSHNLISNHICVKLSFYCRQFYFIQEWSFSQLKSFIMAWKLWDATNAIRKLHLFNIKWAWLLDVVWIV